MLIPADAALNYAVGSLTRRRREHQRAERAAERLAGVTPSAKTRSESESLLDQARRTREGSTRDESAPADTPNPENGTWTEAFAIDLIRALEPSQAAR